MDLRIPKGLEVNGEEKCEKRDWADRGEKTAASLRRTKGGRESVSLYTHKSIKI
jgi:hypothetical protein